MLSGPLLDSDAPGVLDGLYDEFIFFSAVFFLGLISFTFAVGSSNAVTPPQKKELMNHRGGEPGKAVVLLGCESRSAKDAEVSPKPAKLAESRKSADPRTATLGAGDADVPHVLFVDTASGRTSKSNPSETLPFESELASGSLCFLHRPPEAYRSSTRYANYFDGKLRLWELRFHVTFKRPVNSADLRLGTSPHARIPMGPTQVCAHRAVLQLMGPALGGFYNSPGDDPEGRDPEDVERPVTSIRICEADQHIITPAGGTAPDLLSAEFPKLGRTKTTDRQAFRKSLKDYDFLPGDTHTFAFWGPSRLINLIEWRVVGQGLMPSFSMDSLNDPPPIHLTVYALGPPSRAADGAAEDARHLPHRVKPVFSVAGWSSLHPPTAERRAGLGIREEPAEERAAELRTRAAQGRRPSDVSCLGSLLAKVKADRKAAKASKALSTWIPCAAWSVRGRHEQSGVGV